MIKTLEDIRTFMQAMNQPILNTPTIPHPDRQTLRAKLIRSEYLEFVDGWDNCAGARLQKMPLESIVAALAELADALADLVYVIEGTALEYGIPFDEVWDAVQAANMAKLWTQQEVLDLPAGWVANFSPLHPQEFAGDKNTRIIVVRDREGKIRKPPSWKEPDIAGIIRKHMENQDGGGIRFPTPETGSITNASSEIKGTSS